MYDFINKCKNTSQTKKYIFIDIREDLKKTMVKYFKGYNTKTKKKEKY